MSFTHKLEFLDDLNDSSKIPYIGYTYNIVLSDTLIMFHICHLYHNCVELFGDNISEYDKYITLEYIIRSVKEALDNRIKELSSNYIDDDYKWAYNNQTIFDKCLDYFVKIKNELNNFIIKSQQEYQKQLDNKNQ